MRQFFVLIVLLASLASLSVGGFLRHVPTVSADAVSDLNKQLKDQQAQIDALDKEIAQKTAQLQQIGGTKTTLQTALKQLELSRSKLGSDIKKTQTQIDSAETTLKKLGAQIDDLGQKSTLAHKAIASSIRDMSEGDGVSPVEIFLSSRSLSNFAMAAAQEQTLDQALGAKVSEIKTVSTDLNQKKDETAKEKESLLSLQKNLSGQKASVETTAKEKTDLLYKTKNTEAGYQAELAAKKAEKANFEKALESIESKLKLAVNPSDFAATSHSVFSWPLDHFVITQLFGVTADSKRLYASGTHNGVDLAVPIGTPVKAVLDGTVTATGNTDNGTCFSYGKWILIKHGNGLSSMYGHLSSQVVKQGDTVTTGSIIGYSGMTGYATGPHLHLTIYATEGMQLMQYTTSINCKNVVIPIATPQAYLDPMAYLPAK